MLSIMPRGHKGELFIGFRVSANEQILGGEVRWYHHSHWRLLYPLSGAFRNLWRIFQNLLTEVCFTSVLVSQVRGLLGSRAYVRHTFIETEGEGDMSLPRLNVLDTIFHTCYGRSRLWPPPSSLVRHHWYLHQHSNKETVGFTVVQCFHLCGKSDRFSRDKLRSFFICPKEGQNSPNNHCIICSLGHKFQICLTSEAVFHSIVILVMWRAAVFLHCTIGWGGFKTEDRTAAWQSAELKS